MSIQSEINKLRSNLANSYEAASLKGATLPLAQNFNNSTCHVYTDAATKPSNWGTMLNNATWHFSATHEEFENA